MLIMVSRSRFLGYANGVRRWPELTLFVKYTAALNYTAAGCRQPISGIASLRPASDFLGLQ